MSDSNLIKEHPVTTSKKTVAPREDWEQWMREMAPSITVPTIADPEPLLRWPETLLRRTELLQRVAAIGVDVDEAKLRYWEGEGVLPRPVLKWDPEMKARVAHYPTWVIPLIFAMRELQRDGLSLQEIATRIRLIAPVAMLDVAANESRRWLVKELLPDIPEPTNIPDPAHEELWAARITMIAFWPPVRESIGVHVRRYNRLLGNRIGSARLTYYDRDGKELPTAMFPVEFEFPEEQIIAPAFGDISD